MQLWTFIDLNSWDKNLVERQEITKFLTHLLWGGSLVLEICQRRHSQADSLPLVNSLHNRPTQRCFILSELPEGWSVALWLCGSYSFSPAFHSLPPYPPESAILRGIDPSLNSLIQSKDPWNSCTLLLIRLCFFKMGRLQNVWPHRLHSKEDLPLVWKFIIFIMTWHDERLSGGTAPTSSGSWKPDRQICCHTRPPPIL